MKKKLEVYIQLWKRPHYWIGDPKKPKTFNHLDEVREYAAKKGYNKLLKLKCLYIPIKGKTDECNRYSKVSNPITKFKREGGNKTTSKCH